MTYPRYVFPFSELKLRFATPIFDSSGREKNTLAILNTSSGVKLNGAFTKYANPVVAKTLCRRPLRSASASGLGLSCLRAERSTMGREENVVAMIVVAVVVVTGAVEEE